MENAKKAAKAVLECFVSLNLKDYPVDLLCECFAGSREMYTPLSVKHRKIYEKQWSLDSPFKSSEATVKLKITSYTSLLEQVVTKDKEAEWKWH